MKIIVGLGNKGQEYSSTRHNVGFILLDQLAYNKNSSWSLNKKFKAEISKLPSDVLLVKPQTYMNRSGNCVSKIVSFYKEVQQDDLIIVHDDVDLDFGEVKMQKDRGSAGHKGVQDIIDKLGTNEFWRIRVGVGRPSNLNISTEDWVLQKFTENELKIIKSQVYDSFLEKISD